ncbi:MAG: PIN domain-containing protein [Protaetiibacter sp.]
MTTDDEDALHLLDVNVLLALGLPSHVHHERAHRWFDGQKRWCTTPITEIGLVRLVTQPAIAGERVAMSAALELLVSLRKVAGHRFLPDDASPAEGRIALTRLSSSRDVTDAHLVDLAARHGAILATLDRGIPALLEDDDRRHVLVIP